MSDADIPHLRKLHAAATQGPLTLTRYEHGGGRFYREDSRTLVADFYNERDRECIVAEHNAMPALLDELEAARKRVAELERDLDRAHETWRELP